ncbi:hypothetical protein D3C78_834070 [compost metagenome]
MFMGGILRLAMVSCLIPTFWFASSTRVMTPLVIAISPISFMPSICPIWLMSWPS